MKSHITFHFQEEPFVFKVKDKSELPMGKDVGQAYCSPETGYCYYGYCIELIRKINESMNVSFCRTQINYCQASKIFYLAVHKVIICNGATRC